MSGIAGAISLTLLLSQEADRKKIMICMLIPSNSFHFVGFISGIVGHLNAFLHFLMASHRYQLSELSCYLWCNNKSAKPVFICEASVKTFSVNKPVAGWGVEGLLAFGPGREALMTQLFL